LQDLKSLCAKRAKVIRKTKRFHYKRVINKLPKDTRDLLGLKSGATRMPYLSQVLSGQIVNGLRSALDYLIAGLAELDSGPAKRRTQFPVECCKKRFLSCKSASLKGLNAAHVAAIEQLQPYNGCVWTRRMAALSNLDKHNALVPAKMDFIFMAMLDPINGTEAHPSKYKVQMHITPTVYASIGEQFALLEAIQEIEARVTQTLNSFKPEFE
jgi:hypothetical protein